VAPSSAPAAGALVELGERSNPLRSHLLVSTVLGKHVPVAAARCRAAGVALGLAVAGDGRADAAAQAVRGEDVAVCAALLDAVAREPARGLGAAVVVGFSETATGLAHQVAEALDAAWLQTTTRHPDAAGRGVAFAEMHSHAPDQWIVPPPGGWPAGRAVIVDDELTTGKTVAALIRVLHADRPRPAYTVAALVDARRDGAGPLDALAGELGAEIDVVALERRPAVAERPGGWSGGALAGPGPRRAGPPVREVALAAGEPPEREGLDPAARAALRERAGRAARACAPLAPGALVLGCGEHLAFAQLAAAADGPGTLVSSTTRSPALVARGEGYPLRDGLAFPNPEAAGVAGYAYNVLAAERPAIVVHFAEPAHREAGQPLLEALAGAGARELVAVTGGVLAR